MRLGWIFCLLASALMSAADWPQFLGPNRDGTTAMQVSTQWPNEGPRQVWKVEAGQGFAGPVVSEGRVILFHRVGDEEKIDCLEAASGKRLWRAGYLTRYRDDFGFDEGPRSTPAISGGRVFSMGAEGMITALDFKSGERLWQVDARERFGAGTGFFGMACSPLVEGGLVLLNIGGRDGAGIIALDTATGRLKWKATNHEGSYSSPVAAEIGGKRQAFFFTREGLAVLDPASGRVITEFPWRARMQASVNAATPLILGSRIFLSASYGVGAVLLEYSPPKMREIWSGDEILSNHYATSVHHEGHLYGFDGRQEQGPDLVCVEAGTGKVLWREEGFGAGTISVAGNQLVVMKESGELAVAAASPERFAVKAQAQILGTTRAYPAPADGFLYARDKTRLVAVDLRP